MKISNVSLMHMATQRRVNDNRLNEHLNSQREEDHRIWNKHFNKMVFQENHYWNTASTVGKVLAANKNNLGNIIDITV